MIFEGGRDHDDDRAITLPDIATMLASGVFVAGLYCVLCLVGVLQ